MAKMIKQSIKHENLIYYNLIILRIMKQLVGNEFNNRMANIFMNFYIYFQEYDFLDIVSNH